MPSCLASQEHLFGHCVIRDAGPLVPPSRVVGRFLNGWKFLEAGWRAAVAKAFHCGPLTGWPLCLTCFLLGHVLAPSVSIQAEPLDVPFAGA